MAEYTLTLNSDQARAVLSSVDLLMRLKINQPEELIWYLLDVGEGDFCTRRDEARPHLRLAFEVFFRDKQTGKDELWYRLYNLYQVLRKAVHDAEHPETTGVDSYEPLRFTDEPLPQCEWENSGNKGTVPYRYKS